MIELTTGVVFLMSSLYGSGHSNEHAQAVAIAREDNTQTEQVLSIDKNTLPVSVTSDPKAMEKFLKKEFADTPILVDIARCESGFKQNDTSGILIRGRVNKADVGIMQINEKYHAAMAKKLGIDIYSLEGNIEYAKHLYSDSGSQPWIASSPCWSKELAANK